MGSPSVTTTATSKSVVDSATCAMPRSQLVPPPVVTPLIHPFTVVTLAAVLTDVSGRFWLLVALAGASLENVNTATSDGVPLRPLTNAVPAVRTPACGAEPDTSSTSATRRPHWAGKAGLVREFCQMPPDAVVPAPVPSIHVAVGPVVR